MKIELDSIELNEPKKLPACERFRTRKDLLSILESFTDDCTVGNVESNLDGLDSITVNLQRLISVMKQEETKSTSADESRISCHRCRYHIDFGSLHYRCSHCRKIVLCEKCELYSEDFHDYDYIKVKKSSMIDQTQHCQTMVLSFIDDLLALLQSFKAKMSDLVEEKHRFKRSERVTRISAGSKFSKIWNVVNNGTCDWNGTDIALRCISGNIDPVNGERIIPISLKAGQTRKISIDYVIPNDIHEPTTFGSIWAFFRQNKQFGEPLIFNVMGVPIDESPPLEIVYPPCFDLNVPFLSSVLVNDNETSNSKEPIEKPANLAESSPQNQDVNENSMTKLDPLSDTFPIPLFANCSRRLAEKISKHNETIKTHEQEIKPMLRITRRRPLGLGTNQPNQSRPQSRPVLYGSYLTPETRKEYFERSLKRTRDVRYVPGPESLRSLIQDSAREMSSNGPRTSRGSTVLHGMPRHKP